MSFTFEQGDTNRIYLTVLRANSTEPSFPSDYTTPKLRIAHINGGSEVEDLSLTSMTQIGSTNQWFHKFAISASAPFVKHLVTFSTTLDGSNILAVEEFKVIPDPASPAGSGAFPVTVTVKNGVTLAPVQNATVRVFDKGNPTVGIATATTDINGDATVFLDPGTYLIEFSKTGVIAEVHDLIVFANGTHDVVGN